MDNKKIVGFGLVLLVGVIIFLVMKKPKETEDKPEDEKEPPPAPPPPPTPTTSTPTVGGTPNVGTTTTNTGTGGTEGGNTTVIYDPDEPGGAGILNQRMLDYSAHGPSMMEIKREWEIGKNLFNGVSANDWNKHGQNISPKNSCKNFLAEISSGAFTMADYGKFPVFTETEKPALKSEMGVLANDDYVSTNWSTAFNTDFQKYNLASLGGANILSHFGSFARKHELYAVQQAKTFAKNYILEMERYQLALRNAAIGSLKDEGILFQGINA